MRRMFTLLLMVLMAGSLGWSQASFYDLNTVQEIRIQFPQKNWRYQLDSLRYNGEELLIGHAAINGQKLSDVGVRYSDGRAFTPNGRRNSLHLQLDAQRADQHYQGYHSVNLSSALRDPSLVREVLGYEIARDYMPAPLANFAKVYINDEYYGLFVNVEPVHETAFLQRNFGESNGPLYLAAQEFSVDPPQGCNANGLPSLQVEKDESCYAHGYKQLRGEDWQPLVMLTQQLADKGVATDKIIATDPALWMLAFNNALVNLNSYTGQYAHNYYLYRQADGRFVPILGELNLAFGSFKNTGQGQSDFNTAELIMLDPLLHADNPSRPLIHRLLQDELNRKVYLAHLRTIVADHFNKDHFAQQAEKLQQLIKPWVEKDQNQYYTADEFNLSLTEVIGKRSRIPGIVEFMDKRSAWLKSQPVYTTLPPAISDVGTGQRERYSQQKLGEFRIHAKVEDYPKRVHLFYRTNTTADFQPVEMVDDGKHHDGTAGDNVYGVVIRPRDGEDKLEYYIVAENAATVNYSPNRYMYERYEVSLGEINQ